MVFSVVTFSLQIQIMVGDFTFILNTDIELDGENSENQIRIHPHDIYNKI